MDNTKAKDPNLTPKKFFDAPPTEWMVKGVIPRGCVTVLAGDPGEGKTALALQLSGCMMQPAIFLGQSTKPGRVLWVQQDCSDTQMRDVIELQRSRYSTLVNLEGHSVDFSPRITRRVEWLGKASKGYDLLVVDSLLGISAGSINDSEAMTNCVHTLKRIASKNNLAVLLLHHLRKPGDGDFNTSEDRSAGSFAIKAACDTFFSLYQSGHYTELKPSTRKFRGRRDFYKLVLKLDKATYSFRLIRKVPID